MHLVTFSALADFPDRLEAHVRAFPKPLTDSSDKDPDCVEGLHPFVRQLLAYETTSFHSALSQALETDRPRITLTDTPLTELSTDTPSMSEAVDDILEQFQAARKRTLSILEGLSDAQWRRVGRTASGDITVIGLVHHLCAHDWRQLAELQTRMAACDAI